MQSKRALCLVFALSTVAAAAAAPAYVGKWKMNPAKSDFGGMTITYEQLPSGEMQAMTAGQTYKFKLDGKDYPAWFGNEAAWKSLGPASWQTTWKANGKVIATDTVTLSDDGKTLTVVTKGTKPNGEAIDDTMVAARVSGGPGLAGKWKAKNVKSASPNLLEFAVSGTDGLSYKVVDMGLSCEAKLDGKDYPCSGPTMAPGWTVAVTDRGAAGLDMTVKNQGKAVFNVTYTVSSDGKTLTEIGTASATNEKTTVVYDRQ